MVVVVGVVEVRTYHLHLITTTTLMMHHQNQDLNMMTYTILRRV